MLLVGRCEIKQNCTVNVTVGPTKNVSVGCPRTYCSCPGLFDMPVIRTVRQATAACVSFPPLRVDGRRTTVGGGGPRPICKTVCFVCLFLN